MNSIYSRHNIINSGEISSPYPVCFFGIIVLSENLPLQPVNHYTMSYHTKVYLVIPFLSSLEYNALGSQ